MNKKDDKRRVLLGAIVIIAALVVFSLVGFFLADAKVLDVNPFKLLFTVLTLGVGIVFTVYAVITKGGYELAVGGLFLTIGVIILLIGMVRWYGIILIAIAMLALLLLALMALKSKQLIVTRTDEEEGYKPYKSYSEQLAEKEAEEKNKE